MSTIATTAAITNAAKIQANNTAGYASGAILLILSASHHCIRLLVTALGITSSGDKTFGNGPLAGLVWT
jgi:hypothetical protein